MAKLKLTFKGKTIILILLTVLISTFVASGWENQRNRQAQSKYEGFSVIDYKLENKIYKLLLADSPEKREKGLMYFRELEGVDGMIFIFPEKEIQNFWNKNTFMDLEILWIDGDKVVGKSKLPSIEKSYRIVTVESPQPADKVIELPF